MLSGLYRLWARIRVPIVQQWQLQHHRDCMYAGARRGNVDAVADQMHRDEVATLDDECTGAG